jgi:DNA-binding LacI/PurR family transcriptional regulator
LKGIQRALSEVGLTLKSQFYRWCSPTIEEGFQVAVSLLSLPSSGRPTAIITFNDLIAIGVLHAVRTVGLNVPDDISVVGFDDIYLSLHTNPPLTTISQPKYRMGQLAIQKISTILSGNATGTEVFTPLECPLIVRESTAPCKRYGGDVTTPYHG